MLYRVIVRETRVVPVEYLVEADSEDEAVRLAETGETFEENEWDGGYDVTDRTVDHETLAIHNED